jgi:2-C-methyl-D-erythritol 2,4-cyclodiphosphate synthase
MRIGHGYDAHKLVPGRGMTLGGIEIKCDYSLEAHSDGDILVHALIDALLGAAAYGDLGTYFPSEDQSLKNISSLSMLSTVLEKLNTDDYKILNIDLTYVGQVPKLISYSKEIRQNLSTFINMDINDISCKATTTDHLGFEGKLKGISCHCVVLIDRQ